MQRTRFDAKYVLACVALLSGAAAMVPAQQSPPQPSPGQTVIRTTTQEVLLDLVVRDKRGRIVRDLKPEEVEVFEEGAPQKISGFRMVRGEDAAGLGSEAPRAPAAAAATPAAGKDLDPMRHIRLVSLVYEGLDNDARRLARLASEDFLKTELPQNVFVGVFAIDERLRVFQPFTNDLELLRTAVGKATASHYPQFVAESEAIRKQLEAVKADAGAAQQTAAAQIPGRGSANAGGVGASFAEAVMAETMLAMLNSEEVLTRATQSRSSIFSLLSLVKEQAALPGRKTVVFITRGLQVPENMVGYFQRTIGEANRAGVSVYSVDARGLQLENVNATSLSMLQTAAGASSAQQAISTGSVTSEQARIFDTALSSIHANTQETLSSLSVGTGGFLVANTNDFRKAFQQIGEDLLTYYELAYVPKLTEYDGRFRKISVNVKRPDVRVQSRSGYFALPPGEDSLLAYETPLLAALNSIPLPKDVPFLVRALHFRSSESGQEHSLIVEVPLRELAADLDREKKVYRTRLSVLALLKNEAGQVIDRFSRDFPFDVPQDRLEEFRKRNFLHTSQVRLMPGRYTIEAAVVDRQAEKAAARRIALVVAPTKAGVGLSNLVLVRRLDPQAPEAREIDPFHYQGNRVVPTLEGTVEKIEGGGLSFYFVVYPAAGENAKLELAMELSRDGIPIGVVTPELPAPDERGMIQYVASLPLDKFAPGEYQLRTVVRQGESAAAEQTVFMVGGLTQ